jgi:hypothetical protein
MQGHYALRPLSGKFPESVSGDRWRSKNRELPNAAVPAARRRRCGELIATFELCQESHELGASKASSLEYGRGNVVYIGVIDTRNEPILLIIKSNKYRMSRPTGRTMLSQTINEKHLGSLMEKSVVSWAVRATRTSFCKDHSIHCLRDLSCGRH